MNKWAPKLKRSLVGAVGRFTEFLGVKEGVKRAIARFGETSGLLDALIQKKLRAGFRTIIMMYHRVYPFKEELRLYFSHLLLSSESFERQLEFLRQNYQILSLSTLASLLKGGKGTTREIRGYHI